MPNLKEINSFFKNNPVRLAWILAIVFILVGAVNLLVHLNVPIVRNSIIYGKILNNIIEMGGDFDPSKHAYNKPLGFIYLTYPFAKLWGVNIGMKVASFIVASLWTLSLIPIFNRFAAKFNIEKKNIWLFVLLVCFNPLFVYQSMSAYPDLLFALSLAWGLYFLDLFLSKDVKWYHGLLFSFTFIFSIWVKHNGFVFIPIILVFAGFRWNILVWLWKNRLTEFLVFLLSFIFTLIIVLLAQFGGYDFNLFNFGHNTSNFTGGGNRFEILMNNLSFYFLFLFISFFGFSILTFQIKKDLFLKNKEFFISLLIFVASLLFYHGTRYNLRYYLSVAPFFIFVILNNYQGLQVRWQKILLSSFLVFNLFTILSYNSLAFSENVYKPPHVDNLRLPDRQKREMDSIDEVNRLFREEGYDTLIFITDYYGNPELDVWEKNGLFESDLNIVYVDSWEDSKVLKYGKVSVYGYYNDLEYEITTKGNLEERLEQVYTVDFD